MATAERREIPRFTPEQYLALERKAPFKSEFHDGIIEAMAGASRRHNLIAGDVFGEIRSQLKGRPCEVYMGDMKVWSGAARMYSYPDIVAVCGEPRFQDGESDILLNPMVIIEVLSPTTEAFDRGKKFRAYARLESLREYVLIDQSEPVVQRYSRRGDDWLMTTWNGLESSLVLDSIGCEVPLSEIYARVAPAPDQA